ncbi:MAG TPA: ester cyclase [Acidimicrobiia bacterium]|nr:ester cyclase [Acidimicrobiia bacterium]
MVATVRQNLESIEHAFEAYNSGDIDRYAQTYADPVVVVDAATGERREEKRADGIAGTRGFLDSFPDHQCTILRLTAEDDRVVARYVNEATHTGPGAFGEPTGVRAIWGAFSEYRFSDGIVVEVSTVSDVYSLVKQLGFSVTPPTSDI